MNKNIVKETITNEIKVPNKEFEILKKHFSHCFDKESNFDIKKFKKTISKNEIDFSKESYSMDWLGKSYARLLATDSATTLLKEDKEWNQKEENKNSENLLLKGDNLEVLKHLSNNYEEKIKMIYIDPPYNTGTDGFVYEDDRKFSVDELSELAGVDKEKAKKILNFTESKSNSHSAWLTFMYPRLYIAKQLLKDDGVIFISIDDNEVAQLRLLMDEIFGEENFIGQWNWFKSATPPNLSHKIKRNVEYILAYEKKRNNIKYMGIQKDSSSDDPITKPQNSTKVLKFPIGSLNIKVEDKVVQKGIYGTEKYPNKLLNDLIIKNGTNINEVSFENKFVWTQDKLDFELKLNTKVNLSKQLVISYKKSNYSKEVPPNLIDNNVGVGTTEQSGRKLFGMFGKKIFDYPKPVELIQYIINFKSTCKDDIILDFFAGSGTTGHAVMDMNKDGKNRKFILVQIPQPIDSKKNKIAYDFVKNELKIEEPTIFDITKERLIRAGNKIKEDNKGKDLSNIDFGFKIFETVPIWEDYNLDLDEFDSQTKLFDESKLNLEDIQTLLTTWKTYDNIQLTKDLIEIDLDGYKAYYYGNKLYLMDVGFKTENLKDLLNKIDEDSEFNPTSIICFGYNFNSVPMREISENIKSYNNKKGSEIDFVKRY